MSAAPRTKRPVKLKHLRGVTRVTRVEGHRSPRKLAAEWLEVFKDLPDPRRSQGTYHPLLTLVGIALLAVLCGANTVSEIIAYAQEKEEWLSQ